MACRTRSLASAAAAVAVAALAAPAAGQTAQYRWTTEHHDARNSGNSGWIGPAEASGVCKTTVRRAPLPRGPAWGP
jgi:hypothetical protein